MLSIRSSPNLRVNRIPRGSDMDYSTAQTHDSVQQRFFRVTDNIPEESWYWMALASIGISAGLKLLNRNSWALFVGQWPPTFILFGLYHRLIRPSEKSAIPVSVSQSANVDEAMITS